MSGFGWKHEFNSGTKIVKSEVSCYSDQVRVAKQEYKF